MEYISLLLLGLLVWFVYAKSDSFPLKKHFIPALFFKLLTGIGVGILYIYFYATGDTIQYDLTARSIVGDLSLSVNNWWSFLFLSDFSALDEGLRGFLSEPRTLFFVKILSVLYLITGSNYWIASLYLSFISFSGAWGLSNSITRFWPEYGPAASISFLYFPTMVFWSSGVLKESIAFPLICIITVLYILWIRKSYIPLLHIVAGLIALLALWMLKYHYAATLILCAGSGIIYLKFFSSKGGIVKYSGILIATGLLLSLIHPNFHINRIIDVISENHYHFIAVSDKENLIPYLNLGNNYLRFFINIPVALTGGLFMPFPWQGNNWLITMTGMLNLTILIFMIAKLSWVHHFRLNRNTLALSWMAYILLLAIFIAYTTPNFGTLERYKTGYLPFFLLWVFSFNPLLSRIKRLFRV